MTALAGRCGGRKDLAGRTRGLGSEPVKRGFALRLAAAGVDGESGRRCRGAAVAKTASWDRVVAAARGDVVVVVVIIIGGHSGVVVATRRHRRRGRWGRLVDAQRAGTGSRVSQLQNARPAHYAAKRK